MADDSNDGVIKLENRNVCPAKVIGPVETYQWPSFVLRKAKWIPDEEADCCFICRERFNQVRRRHHCRQCGKIVCKTCSKNKIFLPQLGLEKQEKVCSNCFPVADLVAKARSSSIEGVMQGLHSLSMHQTLHNTLIQSGAVKAISHILEKSSKHGNISADGISAIHIFCKTPGLITKVLQDGALLPVLNLCHSGGAVSLVAMKTLCIIAKDKETHSIIVDSQRVQALPQIFLFLNSSEPQKDMACGQNINSLLKGSTWQQEVLTMATALVANLAVCSSDTMQYLPEIIRKGLMSEHTQTKQQTMRAISFLLAYMPEQTTEHLLREGAGAYLIGISCFEKFFKMMNEFFSKTCPEIGDISAF
ncbi:8-like isoform X2 [Octopus vulgaris]|uniref:8-like isoform X2 n=1 Tax=Octopus vulgaris TaxID=6645 RepID=A0AA36C183_OCTVU|nr:8-like isoform X2 [Octopus vulgaris]